MWFIKYTCVRQYFLFQLFYLIEKWREVSEDRENDTWKAAKTFRQCMSWLCFCSSWKLHHSHACFACYFILAIANLARNFHFFVALVVPLRFSFIFWSHSSHSLFGKTVNVSSTYWLRKKRDYITDRNTNDDTYTLYTCSGWKWKIYLYCIT